MFNWALVFCKAKVGVFLCPHLTVELVRRNQNPRRTPRVRGTSGTTSLLASSNGSDHTCPQPWAPPWGTIEQGSTRLLFTFMSVTDLMGLTNPSVFIHLIGWFGLLWQVKCSSHGFSFKSFMIRYEPSFIRGLLGLVLWFDCVVFSHRIGSQAAVVGSVHREGRGGVDNN